MRTIAIILLICSGHITMAQTTITGTVADPSGVRVPGANVFVRGTIDGAATDADGIFTFSTDATDTQRLVVSMVGYEPWERTIILEGITVNISVIIRELAVEMEQVTVTAGSFEASDEKKSVMLKPIDVVTVASSVGDVLAAMATLPGAQRNGDDGLLVVRGGDASETRTFIDGTSVEKPYSSTLPDMPSRGRFSPMMFKGTMFSTGGFSAQYGQALSSVLEFESMGVAESSQGGLSLMSVGAGGSFTLKSDSQSVSSELTYANMEPYYRLTGVRNTWLEYPWSLSNASTFRKKIGRGVLKTMAQASWNESGIRYANLDTQRDDSVYLDNKNAFVNASYQAAVGASSTAFVGISGGADDNALDLHYASLREQTTSTAAMAWMKHHLGKTSVKYGSSFSQKWYWQTYSLVTTAQTYDMRFRQPIVASFVETEHSLSKRFTLRPGLRHEYSWQNSENTLQPRMSLAYKTSTNSQVSVAYGIFRQLQDDDLVKINSGLASAQASHYIANYQYEKNDRLIRTEIYVKTYDKLATYSYVNDPDASHYSTNGNGYARGIDLFYRDKRTVTNADFWLSCSFIDTRRRHKDYPSAVQPDHVSPLTMSAVYKQFFPKIQTQLGFSYTYASGRRYNDPNSHGFMTSTLPATSDLSFCFTYLTRVAKQLVIFHGSVSNILGQDYVNGYRYSTLPDETGTYRSLPIEPIAKRMLFVGAFLNLF